MESGHLAVEFGVSVTLCAVASVEAKYHSWISRSGTNAVGYELHCVPPKFLLPFIMTEFRGHGQRRMYFKGQMSQIGKRACFKNLGAQQDRRNVLSGP